VDEFTSRKNGGERSSIPFAKILSSDAASTRIDSEKEKMWACSGSKSSLLHSHFAYYSPMSGERQSTTRMRLVGQICCACKVRLPREPNQKSGERYCDRCVPRRKVYMSFMLNQSWHCQFLEPDLKTPLPRRLTFATSDKILQLAEHAGALKDLAARQAIEHGIEKGRGGVYLMLTPEQYAKLKSKGS